MPHIFVYGSLKKAYANHAVLLRDLDTKFIGPAITEEEYKMVAYVDDSFPYVLPTSAPLNVACSQIHGELYEISEACLENLDRLEGHPYYYTRTEIYVERRPTYIYLITDMFGIRNIQSQFEKGEVKPIPTGIWNP